MLNARRLFVILVALVVSETGNSILHAESPTIRALEAKAICAAFTEYQRTSPNADLKHFSIIVDREGKDYDIVFLPDSPPGVVSTGGSTKYGAEVHYIVSHRTFKILSMHFAR